MKVLASVMVLASTVITGCAQPARDSERRVTIRATNDFVTVGEYGVCTFSALRDVLQSKYAGHDVQLLVAIDAQAGFVNNLVSTLREAQISHFSFASTPPSTQVTLWAPGSVPGKCGADAFLKNAS